MCAALWLLACLYLYGELERSDVFRWHVANAARARRAGAAGEDGEEYESELAMNDAASSSSFVGIGTRASNRRGMWRVEDGTRRAGTTLRDAAAIAWRVKYHAFAVAITYVVTLSIFPGVLAEDLRDDAMGDWFTVALIAAFNLADVVGKCVPGVYPAAATAFSPRTMAGAAAARVFRAGVLRRRGMVRRRRGGGRGCAHARAWGDQRLVQRERDDDGAEGGERGGVRGVWDDHGVFLVVGAHDWRVLRMAVAGVTRRERERDRGYLPARLARVVNVNS